jgi:hypothetical protein
MPKPTFPSKDELIHRITGVITVLLDVKLETAERKKCSLLPKA